MYLATFTVSILEQDPETGKIDVSYNEVGSTEINEVDVLRALSTARSQADMIVEGLKSAGFKGLTRKDCQIHLRVSNLQLSLDPEWVSPKQLGAGVCPYFSYDPAAPTLKTLHTASGPTGTGPAPTKPEPVTGPQIAAVNLDSPERQRDLLERLANQPPTNGKPSYGEWLVTRLAAMSPQEISKELYRTTSRYNEYLEAFDHE